MTKADHVNTCLFSHKISRYILKTNCLFAKGFQIVKVGHVYSIIFAVLEAYFASWIENIIIVHVSITNNTIANDSLQCSKAVRKNSKATYQPVNLHTVV